TRASLETIEISSLKLSTSEFKPSLGRLEMGYRRKPNTVALLSRSDWLVLRNSATDWFYNKSAFT
ncbi:hypothetical protein PMAYCL1PPCAC_24859, partial [Pristionchus mayeri]